MASPAGRYFLCLCKESNQRKHPLEKRRLSPVPGRDDVLGAGRTRDPCLISSSAGHPGQQSPARAATTGASQGIGTATAKAKAKAKAERSDGVQLLLLLILGPLRSAEIDGARRGPLARMASGGRNETGRRVRPTPSTSSISGTGAAGASPGCAFSWLLLFAQAKRSNARPARPTP